MVEIVSVAFYVEGEAAETPEVLAGVGAGGDFGFDGYLGGGGVSGG